MEVKEWHASPVLVAQVNCYSPSVWSGVLSNYYVVSRSGQVTGLPPKKNNPSST